MVPSPFLSHVWIVSFLIIDNILQGLLELRAELIPSPVVHALSSLLPLSLHEVPSASCGSLCLFTLQEDQFAAYQGESEPEMLIRDLLVRVPQYPMRIRFIAVQHQFFTALHAAHDVCDALTLAYKFLRSHPLVKDMSIVILDVLNECSRRLHDLIPVHTSDEFEAATSFRSAILSGLSHAKFEGNSLLHVRIHVFSAPLPSPSLIPRL